MYTTLKPRHYQWLITNIRTMPGSAKLTPTQRHSTQATKQKAIMLFSINTSTTILHWSKTYNANYQCMVVRRETMSC